MTAQGQEGHKELCDGYYYATFAGSGKPEIAGLCEICHPPKPITPPTAEPLTVATGLLTPKELTVVEHDCAPVPSLKADDEVGRLGPGEMFDEGGVIYFRDLDPKVQSAILARDGDWDKLAKWIDDKWVQEGALGFKSELRAKMDEIAAHRSGQVEGK